MKKMNNKGFSLVELIVVVLIMAIIAVALAPQVMKWVENSRKSTDIENYNALIEAANVATTNETVIKELASNEWTIKMNATSSFVTGTNSGSAFKDLMDATLPGWQSTHITAGAWQSSVFTITIAQNGNLGVKVEKSAFPTKDFE